MPDLSYWGMNLPPQGEYQGLQGLPGVAKQVYDERRSDLTDLMEEEATAADERGGFFNYPSLESLQAANAQDMQPIGTDVGNELIGRVIENMSPPAVAGTIVRAKAGQMVDDALAMMREGKHPQEIISKTGIYSDRAGNLKTQIPDHNSQVAQHEVQRLKRMTDLEVRKLGRYPETRELHTVFRHPELAAEHPEVFAKGKVKYTSDVKIGAMSPKFDNQGNLMRFEVMINPNGVRKYAADRGLTYEEGLRSVMLHEVNHGVAVIDKLPSGSSGDWIKELRIDRAIYENHLRQLKEVQRQLPRTAPRSQEIAKEIMAAEDHLRLLKAADNMDADVLYRHNIGEGDSFWVEQMMNDPNVASKLPSHARAEGATTAQYGNDLPMMQQYENVTATGQHPYMLSPEVAGAVGTDLRASPGLQRAIDDARAARRGQKQAAVQPQIDLGHTSPYKFDKFDLGMAGSGEGAAGYGHGVYLWESPKVGEWYRKNFQSRLNAEKGALSTQRAALEQKLRQPRGVSNEEAARIRGKIGELKQAEEAGDYTAKVYDVEVPDEVLNRVMDWNKELRHQSPEVQEGVNKLLRRIYDGDLKEMQKHTIEEIYTDAAEVFGSQAAASQAFRRQGIVGHRYLDGDSRLSTYGTTNFVIFDDKIPQIRGMR